MYAIQRVDNGYWLREANTILGDKMYPVAAWTGDEENAVQYSTISELVNWMVNLTRLRYKEPWAKFEVVNLKRGSVV